MALGKTVGELKRTIETKELLGWMAFNRGNPFGLERAEFQAAQICSVIENMAPFRGLGARAATPSDYMIKYAKPASQTMSIKMMQANLLSAGLKIKEQ